MTMTSVNDMKSEFSYVMIFFFKKILSCILKRSKERQEGRWSNGQDGGSQYCSAVSDDQQFKITRKNWDNYGYLIWFLELLK
jgi:hypothetical protein